MAATPHLTLEEIRKGLSFRKQLDNLNTPVMYQDAATFGAFVAAEFERNSRLLREAGIKPE